MILNNIKKVMVQFHEFPHAIKSTLD